MTSGEKIRQDAERSLSQSLGKLTPRFQGMIWAALNDYGSVRAIPPEFWDQLAEQVNQRTAAALLIMMMLAFHDTEDDLDMEAIDDADLAVSASPLATRIGQNTSRQWMASVRDRLIRKEIGGEEVTRDDIVDIVTEDGATLTARNGTTVARAASRRSAGGEYVRRNGGAIQLVWTTHPELSASGPCPICEDLDGLPEFGTGFGGGGWAEEFPDGPPAHPNCVCDLKPVPVESI